ncbi:MAG TPA: prolyl oligopeptidase family serine peptidase, partial [Longimicrobiales bacterium]|nr:prolyl oligopeptidase family serine peptidase [Longimicrobiales bacterium]
MSSSAPATPARRHVLLAAGLCLLAPALGAQEDVRDREGYQRPPDPVAEALLAPWHRNVEPERPSPDGRFFVVEVRDRRMPPLSVLARRHHHIGGLQVDPAANRARDLTTESPDGFRILDTADGDLIPVETPEGSRVSTPRWSPDGGRLAFFVHTDDGTYLHVADARTGRSRRVTERPVLATLTRSFDWTGDGASIYAVLVPEGRGPEPTEPDVPTTPRVRITADAENGLRTFPDLLDSPHERALLVHYGTGQLARIEVEHGRVHRVGEPGLIDRIDASPDGMHVRVRTIEEPFSRIVPVDRFARLEEMWDADGRVLAVVDRRGVRDGADEDEEERRREIAWRPDWRGLGFLERDPAPEDVDGDAGGGDDDRIDRVYQWTAPFDSASLRVLHESESRLSGLTYAADGETIFLVEEDEDEEEERLLAVSPEAGALYTLARHDTEDAYDDPGALVTRPGAPEAPVARVSSDGDHVYLRGAVYSRDPIANPPRPFLDRVGIRSGETARLFESAPDLREAVVEVLDDDARQLVLSRQSPERVPDYFVRRLEGGDEVRLTENRNPAPDITGARREAIWATRADGLRFKVEIVLPVGHSEGERAPALFWHYPREYEDEDAYREAIRDFDPTAFPGQRPRSMDTLVRLGYAVVDPDVPIVGPRERWNDRYVVDLRNSLAAAIDALDERGWIDRSRLAIGGHSYGGFGTINALVRTPFFKAGIAGSANSNRTLTPAGFQREDRILWEARETYIRMSPLFWMNEM